jgi:TolA-binding protein
LLKLGLAHQRQGQHEEALRAYDLLIKRFKGSPHRQQGMFERGQALVALKRYPAAAEAFEQVLGQEGAERFTSYALNHLGTIALEGKDFGAADKFFARVAETKADDDTAAGALFRRGQALMAAEQFRDAEEVISRFQREYPSHEHVGQACAQLAIALARQNRHEDALKAIERVEQEFAGALDPSLRATVQYEKAWCLRESGREDAAADAYRKLLAQDSIESVDVHALLELGGIEERAGRYEAAVKVLRRLRQVAAARSADVPRAVLEQGTYRLGVCEFELDHFEQAAGVLEEFITKFPESSLAASASFFCGESLFKTGRQERAVSHLTRVVEEHGSDPICGPSLLRLGECLAGLQRWARSEQVFTQYIDRFGDDEQWFQAQFGIGWARENQKRYDEAISAYRQVVSRHSGPTAARAQFQIGECLFAEKRYEEAARALLKVDILYAYPEWSAAALYEAGRSFEKLGKPVEARAQFKSVIDRYEQTRWAEPASQRLAQVSSGDLPGRAEGHGE